MKTIRFVCLFFLTTFVVLCLGGILTPWIEFNLRLNVLLVIVAATFALQLLLTNYPHIFDEDNTPVWLGFIFFGLEFIVQLFFQNVIPDWNNIWMQIIAAAVVALCAFVFTAALYNTVTPRK
ncbi:MAG: hypothetical protein ACK5YL_01370 [Holosporales bacterium]